MSVYAVMSSVTDSGNLQHSLGRSRPTVTTKDAMEIFWELRRLSHTKKRGQVPSEVSRDGAFVGCGATMTRSGGDSLITACCEQADRIERRARKERW